MVLAAGQVMAACAGPAAMGLSAARMSINRRITVLLGLPRRLCASIIGRRVHNRVIALTSWTPLAPSDTLGE
jgi:hypothetical protein